MLKDPEGCEPVTKQRCSSLLSQPQLTHMGIVETPRHEASLCPVPPGTGGVTTIAPGERDNSSSSSLLRDTLFWGEVREMEPAWNGCRDAFSTLNLFKSVPAFPRISRLQDTKASRQEGAKSTHASKSQSSGASLPGPRSASATRSSRSHTTWRPNSSPCSQQPQKPQAKGLCLKTKALGLLKDPLAQGLSTLYGKASLCACPPLHHPSSSYWRQHVALRDLQSMQSPLHSHLTPSSTAQSTGGASCSPGRLGRQG